MKIITAALCALIAFLVSSDEDRKLTCQTGIILRSAEVSDFDKDRARAGALAAASRVIEGFKFKYTQKNGARLTRVQSSTMITGAEVLSSRVIETGGKRILLTRLQFPVKKEKMKAIRKLQGKHRLYHFEIVLEARDISFDISGPAFRTALTRHFTPPDPDGDPDGDSEADADVCIKGRGWLEGEMSYEPCTLPDGKAGLKISFALRLPPRAG